MLQIDRSYAFFTQIRCSTAKVLAACSDRCRLACSGTEVCRGSGRCRFKQDAFDVAIAGDDIEYAENASFSAFAKLVGRPTEDVSGFDAEEVRML